MAERQYLQNTLGPNVQLGKDGPRIKAGVAGVIQARNSTDSALAIIQAATPSSVDDVGTKNYIDGRSPSIIKKTADQTFSSDVLANVTSLSFALTSGIYYKFEFNFIYQSDTSTVGVQLGLTFPSATRFACTARVINASEVGVGAELQAAIKTSGVGVNSTAVAVINTDYFGMVCGIILPSSNGTLQLQAAREAGTAAGNVIIRQGSAGFLWNLGT